RLGPKPFQNPKKWQACFQPLSSRFPAKESEALSAAYLANAAPDDFGPFHLTFGVAQHAIILAHRGENVEHPAVADATGRMRNLAGNDHDLAGAEHMRLIADHQLQPAVEHVHHLLMGMRMARDLRPGV